MTPEQQRIAIAEACGWRRCCHVTDFKDGCNGENPRGIYTVLPDYLNDLNAMHDALATLTRASLWTSYQWALHSIISLAGKSEVEKLWLFHNATAAQRAEAFLRTIDKWKETK